MRNRPRRALGSAVLAVSVALVATAPALAAVPPPTPVGPSASPSPFPTSLHTPPDSARPPNLHAASAILEDLDSGQVLDSKDADDRRPVASLTKLMTALLVLEDGRLSDVVVVSRTAAAVGGAGLGLKVGERLSERQLLWATLLASANDAATALAEHVRGSVPAFVDMMNARARRMGLRDSDFRSPTGLNDAGYSSAADLARIIRADYSYPLFAKIVGTKFHRILAPSGPARVLQNRNVLLWLYPGSIGVKTGFTTPAGHCVAVAAQQGTTRLLAVVLGVGGTDAGDAFDDGAALLNHGFGGFDWVTLVGDGQILGAFQLQGRFVEAAGARDFELLVRADRLDTVERRLVVDPSLRLPVAAGERVGREEVTVAGVRVGAVAAVAVRAVAAPGGPPTATQDDGPLDPFQAMVRLLRAMVVTLARAYR
jgi:D-alanyl-D-alanine carboxypeptidase (penicillin-binding protein 5/6)